MTIFVLNFNLRTLGFAYCVTVADANLILNMYAPQIGQYLLTH